VREGALTRGIRRGEAGATKPRSPPWVDFRAEGSIKGTRPLAPGNDRRWRSTAPSVTGRRPPATAQPTAVALLAINAAGNRWRPVATDFACFRSVESQSTCERLPPVATPGLHRGSIPWSCQCPTVLASTSLAPDVRLTDHRMRCTRPSSVTGQAAPRWINRSSFLLSVGDPSGQIADMGSVSSCGRRDVLILGTRYPNVVASRREEPVEKATRRCRAR
jgi:hypothetical protein